MTSDQNVSEVQPHQDSLAPPPPPSVHGDSGQEAGQAVPRGMGQSKSSRRRRRKRKGKSLDSVAANGAPQAGESSNGESGPSTASQSEFSPQPAHNQGSRQQSFQSGNGQQQQNGGTTKRWKKKFRDRDRQRPGDNPGNQASNGNGGSNGGSRDRDTHQFGNTVSGFKRKGGGGGGGKQQRGPRSFVGPMDHSYRVVNGNFADAPPSTIETHGNYQPRSNGGGGRGGYQSDSQPIDYSQGRAIPIPEDAPTKIFFFIDDLFFVAKIQETARKLGVKVEFVKNDKESLAKLTGGEEADRPGLIVFDLNNVNAKPITLIPKLKAKLKRSTSIVGFLSHLQGDLKAKAVEAGCDTVMPRAAFSQNLPNLLRRYGIVEEEEPNFNQ
jgi:hypothetical protein